MGFPALGGNRGFIGDRSSVISFCLVVGRLGHQKGTKFQDDGVALALADGIRGQSPTELHYFDSSHLQSEAIKDVYLNIY